jgi:hypothetical protein
MSNTNNSLIKLGLSNILFGETNLPNIEVTGTSTPLNSQIPGNFLSSVYIFSKIDDTGRPIYTSQANLQTQNEKYEAIIFWHNEIQAWIMSFNYRSTLQNQSDRSYSYQYISYSNSPKPSLATNWVACFKENTISNVAVSEI